MTVGTFALAGGVGFCNAVRRTLLSDTERWAGHEVEVRTNTSCQTDEFLAHRLGQIPLRAVMQGGSRQLTLRATGPCTATAADLTGPGFEAVHQAIEVLRLGPDQALDLTLTVDKRAGSVHARYAAVAGVGMAPREDGTHVLRFETVDDRPPKEVLLEALDRLDARVDAALRQLASQPAEPPPSMC